eukprot:sb/3472823/
MSRYGDSEQNPTKDCYIVGGNPDMPQYPKDEMIQFQGEVFPWFKARNRPKQVLQPIRTRYLGHVTGYQPIRGQLQYFLIRSVPISFKFKIQMQSDLGLPGCSGERVLPGKSGPDCITPYLGTIMKVYDINNSCWEPIQHPIAGTFLHRGHLIHNLVPCIL